MIITDQLYLHRVVGGKNENIHAIVILEKNEK